jgi:hypothetical protein
MGIKYGLPYANFYPESLTLLMKIGRSPDLQFVIYLPENSVVM